MERREEEEEGGERQIQLLRSVLHLSRTVAASFLKCFVLVWLLPLIRFLSPPSSLLLLLQLEIDLLFLLSSSHGRWVLAPSGWLLLWCAVGSSYRIRHILSKCDEKWPKYFLSFAN